MKCAHVRWMAVSGGAAMPSVVTQHIESCPECRVWMERDARVQGLLQWKRHEQPDGQLAVRLCVRVREAVAAGEGARGNRWSEWFPTFSLPIARFAIAAVFIGMITFQFLAGQPVPPSAASISEGTPFALGGFGSSAAPYHRFDGTRLVASPLIPAWAEHSALSVTNFSAASVQYGGFFRRPANDE